MVGLLGAAFAMVVAFSGAKASPPAILRVQSDSYQSIRVTFTEAAFTNVASGAGTGDLTASDFAVANGACANAAAITGITKVSSSEWVLALDKAACPHVTAITIAASAVYNAGGEAIGAQSVEVPFTATDLSALVGAFTGVDVPVDALDAPIVGAWFDNLVADVATPRPLTDLIPGLASVSPTTESQLTDALTALPGITGVTFSSSGMDLAFTATDVGSAASFTQSGTVGVPGADFEVSGSVGTKLAFGGSLGATLTSTGAQIVDPAGDLTLAASVTGTTAMTGRVGFVDVSVPNAALTLAGALAVDLDCPGGAASCAAADLVAVATPSGTAQLVVPSLTVAYGANDALTIGDGDPNVVSLDWTLPNTTPTVTSHLSDYDLDNFSRVSLSEVVAGLQFVAGWLQEAEHLDAMATTVPVIGGSLGELTQASAQFQAKLAGTGGLLEKVAALTEDPSAQDAVQLLCESELLPLTAAQCASALDPLTITSDTIEYGFSIDLPATLFGPGGAFPDPQLDLALGDDLEGLKLSAQTGAWTGEATVAVDFTLGLKLTSDAELATELGYDTANDLDEDGVANATDADDDGDDIPESDTLVAGDLCTGLANQLHLTAEDLGHVNGDITASACDAQVGVGASVNTEPSDPTPEVLTADTACLAVAQVHGIGMTLFMEMNSYADATACAAAISATGTYTYDTHVTPVSLANRIYVKADDDPIVSASVTVEGADIGVGATLGFLDLGVTGGVSLSPEVEVSLVDPDTSADDDKIDLDELATAADGDDLDQLIEIDLDGDIEAHFTLTNSLLPSLEADLDIVGDVSAFDNDPDEIFHFVNDDIGSPSDADADADRINVGHNLGDVLNVKNLSPADVVRLVLDFSEQVTLAVDSDAMNTEIPFVGMTVQDMLSFSRALTETAEAVEERDPQTLSEIGSAINDALQAQGFPSGLTIGVTAEEMTVAFDASRSIEASYPFNLDLDQFGVPIPLLQVDGGATLSAQAGVEFNPEVGILFDGTSIADRIFVRNITPTFSASADATVNGAVSLGPLSTALNGDLSLEATVAVGFNDDADADGDERFTIKELKDFGLDDLVEADFSGPFSAHLEIDTPEAFVDVEGDLSDPSAATITHDIDLSSIKLDLGTLVTGATESAKFIGRTLQQSNALSTDMPLLGDALAGMVTVGEDIEDVAEQIEAIWAEAAANSATFLDNLEGDMEEFLCPTLDCVTITLTDTDDEPTEDLNDAAGILVNFTLAHEETMSTTLAGGIDLAPVFELDASVTPTITYGYRMQVGFGLSISDGFYLKGGDVLDLYARFDTGDTINVPVKVGGISAAAIVDGSATIGGTAGPDDNAAGFTVSLPDKLSFRDIANRRKSPDSIISAEFSLDADMHLPLQTTFTDAPNLFIPVFFSWHAGGNLTDGAEIGAPTLTLGTEDEPVTLDASSFVNNVVAPILEQANEYNPLSQVPQIKQTLDSEIPVLDSTVRELVRGAVGDQPAWKVFEFLVDMDEVVAQLQQPGAGVIEIGWVEVLPSYELHRNPISWFDQPAGSSLGDILTNLNRLSGGTGSVKTTTPAPKPTATAPGRMFSFPILDDPMTAVGMVLGGDFSETVSFIEFRAPALNIGPQIHWSQTLFNLDIGFVSGSISLQVDGFIGLEVRLGFGYDSTGLQPGRSPLDGIYLVDFKDDTHDLQEIAVGGRVSGTISGNFAVAGGVASASFRGSAGVNLTAGIDFNDESVAIPVDERGDGKFHLYEIAQVATASRIPGQPKELAMVLCPFRPSVNFSAFLQLRAKAKALGITVFDESYSDDWTLVDWALECELETKIAKLVDGQLVLNAGPTHAVDRFDGEGDVAEHFGVNLVDGGSNVEVSWTGGAKPSLKFPANQINQIYGDLGASDDTVTIDPAVNIPAILIGGAGGDTLQGGSAADQVQGNAGDDTLSGGAGDDAIEGGDGNDAITGGGGADDLQGNDGNDTYSFAPAWGTDILDDATGSESLSFATVTEALHGSSSFGEATIAGASSSLAYSADQVDAIVGGSGADTFTLAPDMPDGLSIDAAGGADTVVAPMSGQTRTVDITDSGSETTDTLRVIGTPGRDTFLLRATSTNLTTLPTDGFVAMLAPGDLVDRLNYDHSLDKLELDTDAGRDRVALDDLAVPATIQGAAGADTFQIGQVFAHPRDTTHGIAAADVFATADTTRGRLSKGISYATTIDGGNDNDAFNVYSNKGVLNLNGGDGNDVFQLRAFVEAGSLVMKGEAGTDQFQVEDFDYVDNELVEIDGGAGADTVVLVGTELDDGFLVSATGLQICQIDDTTGLPDPDDCAVTATYVNIESVQGQGLEGDDVFQVLSTASTVATSLFGSENSDTFIVGDDGDVTGIQGSLRISGEADPEFDTTIAPPVVLPGEDISGAHAPAVTSGTNVGDTLRIDAFDNASGNTGSLTDTTVTGLGMGATVTYGQIEFATVELDGEADTFNVVATHEVDRQAATVRTHVRGGAGADVINVQGVADTTRISGEAGNDTVNVGTLMPSTGGTVHAINARLDVVGGDGTDSVYVDDRGDPTANTLTSVQGRITGLGLTSEGITHSTIELLDVSFGAGDDVANVKGTSTATVIHGNNGDERYYVADTAAITPGTSTDHLVGDLDDIDGDLTIDAGAGRHTLLVSDDASTTGDGTTAARAVIDEDSITGLSSGSITYGGAGTFAGGITVWTSQGADALRVGGARLDGGVRTVTTVNTNLGDDNVVSDLDAGTDGFVDVNLEEGNDTFDAGTHSLPLVVFGGVGNDTITTGSGDDVVLGDVGHVAYGTAATVLGNGGPGDTTDGVERAISSVTPGATNGGNDTVNGGAGSDWISGQEGTDTIRGGDGPDAVFGDRASGAPGGTTTLLDVATLTTSPSVATYGDDHLAGDDGADTLFGQGGNDRAFGGDGNDQIEGNHADDCLMGGAGDDNIIGGGSARDGVIGAGSSGTGLLDGHDVIYGDGVEPAAAADLAACNQAAPTGAGADVLAGDNARIRTGGVRLFDVETATSAADADVHDADTVSGGGGVDWLFGQGANDTLNGDAGDDVVEGNSGADAINGGTDQDDLTGGSSTGDGLFRSGVAPTNVADGADTIHGNDAADVALGDNGVITRTVVNGAWRTLGDQFGNHNAEFAAIVIRATSVPTTAQATGAFGNDAIYGDAGADELIGQQGNDVIEGNAGADALVGDIGAITTTLESGARAVPATANAPFMTTPLYQAGTLTRQVQLWSFRSGDGAAGTDVLLGGDGSDAVHGGPGADVINGNGGDDFLFGGDDNDAMWGGPGNDDSFGGTGADYLDVVPRSTDPAAWRTYAAVDHLQGFDLLYGGWDQDAMQADFQQNGQGVADRLVDWSGTYNAYFVCNGGGAGTIIRSADPSTILYLQSVAAGRGGYQVTTPNSSSGYNEAAIVFTSDVKKNTSPAHPEGRGQGVCPPA